jgi:hypothetical protein
MVPPGLGGLGRLALREGLYKCQYTIAGLVGRSIMYVQGGRMLGGNTAFAHIGTYETHDGVTHTIIETRRHNPDPNYPSMLGQDIGSIDVKGRIIDGRYHFEGTSPQMPGEIFRSQMWTIESETTPVEGAVGAGGIANGLYSVHIRTLDGVDGGLTGVMLLHDGRILGGDAFFYYLGTYTSAAGRWKGEMLNQEHTPSKGEVPVFGGHEVGIGFTGTCDEQGGTLEATAFVGKRSVRLTAVLKLIRQA